MRNRSRHPEGRVNAKQPRLRGGSQPVVGHHRASMAREIQLASPVGQEDTRASALDSDDKRASDGAAADATDDEQAQLVEHNALDGVHQPSGADPSANTAPTGHGKQAEQAYAAPISSRVAGLCALVVATVTCFAVYDLTVSAGEVSPGAQRRRVLWYGWITAVSTGFGVVPFFFLGTLQPWWVAVCNGACIYCVGEGCVRARLSVFDFEPLFAAVAAGMMISASIGLVTEGASMAPDDFPWFPVWLRAIMGTVAGGLFIIATQRWLEKYEDLKFSGFSGASAKKMLVIMAVMTVHSFTEGVSSDALLTVRGT